MRLSTDGTRIACQIRNINGGEVYVSRHLQGNDFSKHLTTSTRSALGNSDAIHGDLLLAGTHIAKGLRVEDGSERGGSKAFGDGFKKWYGQILAVALLVVASVLACCFFPSRKERKAQQPGPTTFVEGV